MSSNVAEVVGHFRNVEKTLPPAMLRTAHASAQAVRSAWLGIAAANGLRPGGKIGGKPWGVDAKVKAGAVPEAKVQFTGSPQLAITPAKPHAIVAGGTTSTTGRGLRGIGPASLGAASGRRALAFKGIARHSVNHPGTKGKPAVWPACKKAAQDIVPKIGAVETRSALTTAGIGTAKGSTR